MDHDKHDDEKKSIRQYKNSKIRVSMRDYKKSNSFVKRLKYRMIVHYYAQENVMNMPDSYDKQKLMHLLSLYHDIIPIHIKLIRKRWRILSHVLKFIHDLSLYNTISASEKELVEPVGEFIDDNIISWDDCLKEIHETNIQRMIEYLTGIKDKILNEVGDYEYLMPECLLTMLALKDDGILEEIKGFRNSYLLSSRNRSQFLSGSKLMMLISYEDDLKLKLVELSRDFESSDFDNLFVNGSVNSEVFIDTRQKIDILNNELINLVIYGWKLLIFGTRSNKIIRADEIY